MLISAFTNSVLRTSLSRPFRLLSTMSNSQQPKIYNLQSDTTTEPTDDMFDIMRSASRSDDVFGVRKL